MSMPQSDNELETAGTHSSGSGASDLFKVEVRTTSQMPTVIDKFVIDNHWREMHIVHDAAQPYAVNIPSGWDERVARAHHIGLVSKARIVPPNKDLELAP